MKNMFERSVTDADAGAAMSRRFVSRKGLASILALVTLAILLASVASAQSNSDESASEDAPDAFLTIDLAAGFPLDPFLVSLNGGGEVAAGTLSEGCVGYVNADPTATVNWIGESDFVEAFFYSDHDPVLVVQLPDGSFMCNDDANPLLLDPVVQIDDPAQGRYNIWVGSHAAEQLIPGLLVLTTRDDINLGTFTLEGLIRRGQVPEDVVEHEEVRSSELILEELAEADVMDLEDDGDPIVEPVASEGDLPAFDIPMGGLLCNGFIEDAPHYVFDWDGDVDNLRVFFEGDGDATLLIVTEAGAFFCNDDATAGENLNPMIDIPNPEAGRYHVFVGRVNPDQPVTGELTIAESSELAPETLDTEETDTE